MLSIKAIDNVLIQEIHHLYDSILHDELREKVFQILCEQQAIREGSIMLGEEVVEWGIEKILEVLITTHSYTWFPLPPCRTRTASISNLTPSHLCSHPFNPIVPTGYV